MMRLTKRGRGLLVGGVMLVFLGVAFGNVALVLAGALPLLVLAGSTLGEPDVRVTRDVAPSQATRGGRIRIEVLVEGSWRRAFIEVHQPLPVGLYPADDAPESSNLRLFTRPDRLGIDLVALRRGAHVIAPPRFRVVDALGLAVGEWRESGRETMVEVIPRERPEIRDRLRLQWRAASPVVHIDRSPLGVASTDFREIRQYVAGDPMRNVNWKATARRSIAGRPEPPLVNEYEREGRRVVWVVVDASSSLAEGPDAADAREDAFDAGLTLASEALRHGFRVGAAVVGAKPGTRPLHPEAGTPQLARIRRYLAEVEVSEDDGEPFDEALARIRAHVVKRHPLFLVVTRLDASRADLAAGLQRIRGHAGLRLRGHVGLVIDVEPAWRDVPRPPFGLVAIRIANQRLGRKAARDLGFKVDPWRVGAEATA